MPSLQFLIELTVKSTTILLAAAGLAYLLRSASAAARQLLWTLTLISLLLLPFASLVVRPLRWMPPVTLQTAVGGAMPIKAPSNLHETTGSSPNPWREAIGFVYLSGVAAVIFRLAIATGRLWWLTSQATRVTNSAWRQACSGATLLVSDRIPLPVAHGWRRPVILLPAASVDWPLDRLRLVFAHELAHIRRWDYPGQIAARLACALYWFHPLAWRALRQLVREREQACDDEVINMGFKGTDYAEHLLAIVRSVDFRKASLSPAVGMAEQSNLENRVRAMLDAGLNRRAPGRRAALLGALGAACILLPLAAFTAHGQAASGTISGVVRDPSGAVIPRAPVTATNADGSNIESTHAGADGSYRFSRIPAGRYAIEVRSRGFQIFEQKDIVLAAGGTVQMDPALQMGSISENVEVVGQRARSGSAPTPSSMPQRIRVGGNVQASKIVTKVNPVYPEKALRDGIEGTVLLTAVIGTDGRLLSLAAASASSDPELTSAALDAVRLWTYQPTLLNGQPVEVHTTIAVTFRLS